MPHLDPICFLCFPRGSLTGISVPLHPRAAGPNILDVTVGTGQAFWHLLFPNLNDDAYSFPIELQLWQIREGVAAPVINTSSRTVIRVVKQYRATVIALSPNRSHVATIAYKALPTGTLHRSDMPELDKGLEYRIFDLPSGESEFPLESSITPLQVTQSMTFFQPSSTSSL